MKYERLTERDRYWIDEELWTQSQEPTDEEIDKIYNRLAELEDKIEGGTLAELPCKVGDVAWYVIQKGQYSTLCSTTISRICIDSPNRMVIYLNGTVRKIYIGYAQDDNAFLTKAEAEKRLKELRGEK